MHDIERDCFRRIRRGVGSTSISTRTDSPPKTFILVEGKNIVNGDLCGRESKFWMRLRENSGNKADSA